jgi:hypothetical protein
MSDYKKSLLEKQALKKYFGSNINAIKGWNKSIVDHS